MECEPREGTSTATSCALVVQHENVRDRARLQKLGRGGMGRQDIEVDGDDISIQYPINMSRTDRGARDIYRTNKGTRAIGHEHVHLGGRYRRLYAFQIDVRNFDPERFQFGTSARLAEREPPEAAIEVAADWNEPGRRVLLSQSPVANKD